jgi:hypothetical protein
MMAILLENIKILAELFTVKKKNIIEIQKQLVS